MMKKDGYRNEEVYACQLAVMERALSPKWSLKPAGTLGQVSVKLRFFCLSAKKTLKAWYHNILYI